MKISGKLILIGVLVITVPLALIGFFSISRASAGLKNLEYEQLETRTFEIAEGIDNVLHSEMKVILDLSVGNATLAALAEARTRGLEASAEELSALTAKLKRFIATPGLAESYQGIIVMDMNADVVASSHDNFVGVNVKDRDYFQEAVKGTPTIGRPARNKVTGEPFVALAAPVYSDTDEMIGVVGALLQIGFLNDLILHSKIGETGYAVLMDAEGITIAHPDESLVFEVNIFETPGLEAVGEMVEERTNGILRYTFNGVAKTAGIASVPSTGWGIMLSLPDSEFLAPVNEVRNIVLLIGGIAFAVSLTGFIIVSRTISQPLRKAARFASEISGGDLTSTFTTNLKDEVGDLSKALGGMVGNLKQVVGDIQGAAEQVTSGSEQMSTAAEQLSSGASEQAASIEEVSSSMEQMKSNISQNADNAVQTEKIALQAASKAEESGREVVGAVDAIKLIAEKITIIEEIARQTNMLSLNASIEAARAGEHGKGFAVVAAEVGKLAARSKEAANEIGDLSTSTVHAAERAGTVLGELVPEIKRTADLVQEISASSREQDAGADQINSALSQLDMVIQRNASASEELASLSEELTSQAMEMQSSVSFFVIENGGRSGKLKALPERTGHGGDHRHSGPAGKQTAGGNGSGQARDQAVRQASVENRTSGSQREEQGITLAEEQSVPDYDDLEHF